MATTVKDILKKKGKEIWSVSPEATVYEALELMADKNIGAVVVMEGDKLVGIFSERDYARKVILQGKSSKDCKVSELMTKKVLYVSSDYPLEACLALMTEEHVRHLPVLDDGKLVGIISIGDVVHEIISNQKFTISELERYIFSGG
jgi:CBS domain-containing protein